MSRLSVILSVLLVWAAAGAYAQTSTDATSAPGPTAGLVQATSSATAGRTTGQSLQPQTSFVGLSTFNGRPSTETVLVIPGKPLEAQALDRIVEDLTIMGRIIEKDLSPEVAAAAPGDVFVIGMDHPGTMGPEALSPSPGRVKPMYVGGYGAVFFLRVDFPLVPPPETPEPPAKTEKADSVWAEAKRSLQAPEPGPFNAYQQAAPAPQPYNAETATALKARLIASMKHAANIEVISPDEWLAIVVQAPAPAPGAKTVLTLRAKKADIDQFAAAKLDRTQFEQRVQTIAY
jgi:hypothetical protein